MVVDVASNRKMLQALLKKNGAKKVDTAENGLEAVQAAQANAQKYDIIFMDNFMPVMVTPTIHTIPAFWNLPCLRTLP